MKKNERTVRAAGMIAVLAGAVLVLSACASAGSDAAGAAAPSPTSSRAARVPGVSGQVAAVSGSTAQVQSRAAQTAVTWTSATTFQTQESADAASVVTGDCVVVRADPSSGDASATPPTAVTAVSVEVTSTGATTCASGFGAGPGGGQGGGKSGSGGASGQPTARPGGFGGLGAIGRIAAVGSGSFTVTEAGRGGSDETSVTVTTTSSTTYSQLVAGTAADVVTGACVQATGAKDDTGAVTAKTIVVTQPVDGACTAGFGGRGGSGSGDNGSSDATS